MGVETPESIPGRAALIPASERAFPITPNPPFILGGPSEPPSANLRAADGVLKASPSGLQPTFEATHRYLVTVPICPDGGVSRDTAF